ncbi:hypothetical protein CJ739_3541 [Mariniflexile rhizosphaerae]|uniref:hypothetical protein n=1 Tax=unclassified Mariniflexile TaxID=2643887 RepID=UPI000CC84040|nr:hypothetical protein [Mariniflexile sp. TRM1-10]AXP82603.1 hypothetical protein CJ739_3541 [Mariniflexile sp. TRM1-10]PLB19614.1 MAG: putative lipoprotein [Flavobacteriaceae bacterium FS1-H7996/R]
MNKLIYILVIILAFVSCNGGKTKKDALKTSVEKFKDSIGTLEIEKYIPEAYSETITDTILSNGFKVKIKTFTDMEHSVLNMFKQDTIVYKHYYRDAIAEITIFKNDIQIVSQKIDKSFFLKRDNELKDYFEIANLSGVWLNEKESLDKDKISIFIMFCKPETDYYYLNEMIVDGNGEVFIHEITEKT